MVHICTIPTGTGETHVKRTCGVVTWLCTLIDSVLRFVRCVSRLTPVFLIRMNCPGPRGALARSTKARATPPAARLTAPPSPMTIHKLWFHGRHAQTACQNGDSIKGESERGRPGHCCAPMCTPCGDPISRSTLTRVSKRAVMAAINTTATLSSGALMPMVGFGCAGQLGRTTLGHALAAGYMLFDTAQATEWYAEPELGAAIRASNVSRESLFLTSKLHPRDLGEQSTLKAFPRSLASLGTSYLDAFLLHYPRCFGNLCGPMPAEGTWRDSWRALESLYERGEVRAIGVSNFGADELKELIGLARVKPHIVQSWMDPLHQERPVREVCRQHGILFQAYSTLGTQWAGQGVKFNPVLRHPVLARIAAEVGRSAAQVALRWAVQHGVAVIPRSSKPSHMAASLALFDFGLTDEHMRDIDNLDGADPASIHLPPPPPRSCEDENEACGSWADSGECENNPGYMHDACAASCNMCEEKKKKLEL